MPATPRRRLSSLEHARSKDKVLVASRERYADLHRVSCSPGCTHTEAEWEPTSDAGLLDVAGQSSTKPLTLAKSIPRTCPNLAETLKSRSHNMPKLPMKILSAG